MRRGVSRRTLFVGAAAAATTGALFSREPPGVGAQAAVRTIHLEVREARWELAWRRSVDVVAWYGILSALVLLVLAGVHDTFVYWLL